jgi:hypothetical protein
MTVLELPNGARATIQNGEWTSTTLGLANMLERMIDGCYPGPADGDPEWFRAHHVATRIKGRIVDHAPKHEHVL